jgi:glutamate carboxypeptidase
MVEPVSAEVLSLVPTPELRALNERIAAAEPAYLADLAALVNIDCGSYTKAGVDEVGRRVATFLEGIGATVVQHPHETLGETVVGTIAGMPGAPRLLLIGHMDTVFDPGTAEARPFRIDDGRAYGPGVTDMKSGLLAGLYALKALVESGGLPFGRLTFVANPDEEIGSPSSTPIIRTLAADADVSLVLECARANGDIVSSRKGIVDARLTVHGRAAHAGVEPEKGRSAILAAAHLTTALHDLNGRWDGVTCNVGVIGGGTRPNVVPEEARLEVDVRAVRGDDLDAAVEAIRALIATPAVPDVTVDLNVMASWRPMEKLARSGRLVELAVGLARDLGFDLKDAATGGASDANTTSGMGIPSLDGLGPIGGNDHAPAEYLEVDSIVPRTTLVAALILAIGRDPVVRSWRQQEATGPR